jgi:hypothetical protein
MPIDGVVRRARVALVLLVAATSVAVGARVATSAAAVEPAGPLVEAPGCGAPPPPPVQPLTVIARDGTSATAPITLVIPPTAFVRVGSEGDPVAVMTNTGCAPRATDRVLIEVDPTHAVGAPAALAATVMALPFTGDWRPAGSWHHV